MPAIRSLIEADERLVKEADKLVGTSYQESVNRLIEQLVQGNLNPGIGTKRLFVNILEARARDGARVYFRVAEDTAIEILGKSTKANQGRVIGILEEMYG